MFSFILTIVSYKNAGHGLLFLLPSELAFLSQLSTHRPPIPISKVSINPAKLTTVTALKFASFIASNAELKLLAQKALITSLRAVYLASNKEVASFVFEKEHMTNFLTFFPFYLFRSSTFMPSMQLA